MNKYRNFGYSLVGGGGALGSILISRGCLGSCYGCYSCLAVPGLIVTMALYKTRYSKEKGEHNELAPGDH
jgi:hypothetical protein